LTSLSTEDVWFNIIGTRQHTTKHLIINKHPVAFHSGSTVTIHYGIVSIPCDTALQTTQKDLLA
jgi:hypothetical protein